MAEKVFLVSAQDIFAIGWHCPHCGAIYSVPVHKLDRGLPSHCPNCNEVLAKGHSQDENSDVRMLEKLLFLLRTAKEREFSKYLCFQVPQEIEKKT